MEFLSEMVLPICNKSSTKKKAHSNTSIPQGRFQNKPTPQKGLEENNKDDYRGQQKDH